MPATAEEVDLSREILSVRDTIVGEVKGQTDRLDKMNAKIDRVQDQADAIDLKMAQRFVNSSDGDNTKSFGQLVTQSEEFIEAKERGLSGRKPLKLHLKTSVFERKSVLTGTALGSGAGGVVGRVMLDGRVPISQQGFRLRDLLKVRTLDSGNAFDFIRQTTRTNNASPQIESQLKSESNYSWDVLSGSVRTIAHFTNVTRQALDDIPWLQETLDGELRYGLALKEEAEILFGDGTGEHLNGIMTQATNFNTALLPSRYTQLEILRLAKLQARLAGLATYAPDAFVLHPTDMANIELIRDDSGGVFRTGRYLVGDPKAGDGFKTLWDLPVVESDSLTQGTFLCGSFGQAATLVDRMATTVEVSYQHASNFTSNIATILCEERVGLSVSKPSVFIKGSFSTSPA